MAIKKSLFKADKGFKYDNLSIFHGSNDPTVTPDAEQTAASVGSEYVLDSTGEKYIKKASGWEKLTTLGELPNISNISYREPVKVSASDTTLPTGVSGNNITVDGVSIDNNERVLFGNLSSGNKNIYIYDKASGLFIEDTNTVSAGDVTYIVGGTDGGKQVVFNGTSWVLFNQVALDELGYLRSFMGKNAAGNEMPSYSSNNYIANSDSLETALGKLDTAINSIATSSGADETNIRNFIGKAATGATLPQYSSNNFIQDNWSLQQAVSTLDLWLGTDHTNLGNAQTDIQDIKNNLIPQLEGKVLNGVKYLADCTIMPTTATFFADIDDSTNSVTVVGGDYVAFSNVPTPGVYRWNGAIYELQPMIHEGRVLVVQKDYETDLHYTNVRVVVFNANGNYFEDLATSTNLTNLSNIVINNTNSIATLNKVTEFADFKAFNATIPTTATFNTDFDDTINPITVAVGSKVLFLELINQSLRGLYEWTGSGFTRISSKTSLFSVKYNEALGTFGAGVGVQYGDGQEVGVLINAQGGYAFLASETNLNNQLANYVLTSTLTSDYYNQTQVNSLISNIGNKITKVKYSVSRTSLPTSSTFFADDLNQFSVTVANGDLVVFPYLSAANIGIYKWNNANSKFDLLVDINGNRENILFYVEYDSETNTLFDYSIDGVKPGIVMKIGSNYHIQFLASNEFVSKLDVNLNNIYREVFKNGQVYEVADSGVANTNNTFITVSDLITNGFADINDFLKLTLDITMKNGTNFTSFKIDVIVNEDGTSADSSAYAILNIGTGVNYSYTFDTNKDLVLTSTNANASIKVKRVVVYGMTESTLFQ